jgi:cytochrome c peroxidase
VPSLRRVSAKYPYFTNGSAKSLDEVVARARFPERGFAHDGAPADGEAMTPGAAAQVVAFLGLL